MNIKILNIFGFGPMMYDWNFKFITIDEEIAFWVHYINRWCDYIIIYYIKIDKIKDKASLKKYLFVQNKMF